MTLDQLSMFVAVVDQQSFSEAAKKLNISQPSISVAVKNLEYELKIELFDRKQYRPRLTAAGHEIYVKAKHILSLEKELKLSANLLSRGEESHLKIILDIVAPLPQILDVIRAYFAREKACQLELSFCVLGIGIKNVLAGDADLYIGPVFEEYEKINSFFYSHYAMIPVISRRHELGRASMAEIKAQIHEVPRVFLRYDAQLVQDDAPRVDDRVLVVEDYLIKKETIVAGLGWGRLPLWNIEPELKKKTLIDIRDAFASMRIEGDILVVPKRQPRGKHLNAILTILTTSK